MLDKLNAMVASAGHYNVGEYKVTKVTVKSEDELIKLIKSTWVFARIRGASSKLYSLSVSKNHFFNDERKNIRIMASDADKLFIDDEHFMFPYKLPSSSQAIDFSDDIEIYTLYDTTAGYDFIKLPAMSYDNAPTLFVKTHDGKTGRVFRKLGKVFDFDDEEGKESKTYIDEADFYAYVGWNKYIPEEPITLTEENAKGRYIFNRIEKRFYRIHQLEKDHNSLKFVSTEFAVPNEPRAQLTELNFNILYTYNPEYDIVTDLVDEKTANEELRNEDGYLFINPITPINLRCRYINVNDKCIICRSCEVPILVDKEEKLVFSGSGELKLVAAAQQPCIGSETTTGMSYGRWSFGKNIKLKEIVVDGCTLIFNSKVPNFSIGVYGQKEYPTLICINGGKVIGCPEAEGERILKKEIQYPQGSTKISEKPEYVILPPGEQVDSLLEDWQIELKEKLEKEFPKFVEFVNFRTIKKYADTALKLLSINPDLDVSPLFKCEYTRDLTLLTNCVVLGMPAEASMLDEWFFEGRKDKFIKSKYSDIISKLGSKMPEEDSTYYNMYILHELYNNREFDSLSEFEKRVVYEMIPSYSWNFSGRSNEDNARAYYNGEV